MSKPRLALPAASDDDDDVRAARTPIQDPVLHKVRAGPDVEPPLDRLLKGRKGEETATGGPVAGRAAQKDARRQGPKDFLQILGPGLITGASDDDPSGIGTYSQVGSQFGYNLLWTALFTFPLMAAMQELCARIALQTGVGLGISLRRKFPTALVGICILALFCANTINVGADLGAVAAGGRLLSRGAVPELWLVAPVALLVLAMELFVNYSTIFKVFKWLTLTLFAYVVTGILVHPDVLAVLRASVVPHLELNRDFITALVAIFGTTISPYLFFWQASSEVDEMRAAGKRTEAERRGVQMSELKAARFDILVGMFFSNVVMYFIILTTASVLHAHGKTDVQTADQAAQALAPLAGPFAFILFAGGMIGTGLLAIPILSGSAAYAVKEFFGIKGGLTVKPWYRPTFYGVMALAVVAGIGLNLLRIDPIHALFITAVINGVVAPPLMVLIVLLGSDREVMEDKVSGRLSRWLTWIATLVMGVAAIALLATLVKR